MLELVSRMSTNSLVVFARCNIRREATIRNKNQALGKTYRQLHEHVQTPNSIKYTKELHLKTTLYEKCMTEVWVFERHPASC